MSPQGSTSTSSTENRMDVDNPESLGDSSGSDSDSPGRSLLFEDVGENCDSDSVPIVRTHHPVLDGQVFVIPQILVLIFV